MANLSRRLEVIIDYAANLSGIDQAIKRQELFQKSYKGLSKDLFEGSKIINQTTKTFERQGKIIAQVNTEYKKGKGPIQSLTREFEVQAVQIRKNGRFTGEWSTKLVELNTGLKATSTTATRSLGVFANLGGEFKKIALRAFLTVPAWQAVRLVIQGLSFAVSSTVTRLIELDSAVRKVRNVFEPFERTVQESSRIRTVISELSSTYGKSAKEIGDAYAEIARAGLGPETSAKALVAAQKLSITSGADINEVTKALVLTYNLFGEEIRKSANGQDEFNVIAGFLNKVANKNIESLGGFISALKTSAGVANTANVSFSELSATLTLLQNVGFGDAQAGTIFNRIATRTVSQIEKQKELIKKLSGGEINLTGKESVFDTTIVFFKSLAESGLKANEQLKLIDDFFGEKGIKSSAFLKKLPELSKLLEDFSRGLINSEQLIAELDSRQADILGSTEIAFKQIGQIVPQIGEEILKIVTGTNNINSAAVKTKEAFEGVRETLELINNSDVFKLLKTVGSIPGKIAGGVSNVIAAPAVAFGNSQIEDLKEKRLAERIDISRKRRELVLFNRFKNSKNQSSSNVSNIFEDSKTSSEIKSDFIFDEAQLRGLLKASENIKTLGASINKTEISQKAFNTQLKELRKLINSPELSNKELTKLIQQSPDEIGKFLKSKGLNIDNTGITKSIKEALKLYLVYLKNVNKDNDLIIKRETELKEIQLDRLSALGFSELEIADLKLRLYDTIDNADEQRHKRAKARIEAEGKRIIEISEQIKSSFQSNFESFFKNEITPKTLASNIGDTFQNQSISSSARLATEAVLGTGIAAQFASAIDATEQNPIVRSFIEGARKAGTIIEQSMVTGAAKAQTGVNTGDVTGKAGLLGGLFPNFNKKGTFANAPNLTQSGLLNAGITGALTGLASSQRGGAAGILGGGGGFLTSLAGSGALKGATGLLGAIAPALGPIGAALTIASFFTKSKKTETRTEEQLISIAPKIDVSNKKLELINRNLVALKNVMEIYVLPQSSYYSESRNISDTFSIYARRGLA